MSKLDATKQWIASLRLSEATTLGVVLASAGSAVAWVHGLTVEKEQAAQARVQENIERTSGERELRFKYAEKLASLGPQDPARQMILDLLAYDADPQLSLWARSVEVAGGPSAGCGPELRKCIDDKFFKTFDAQQTGTPDTASVRKAYAECATQFDACVRATRKP